MPECLKACGFSKRQLDLAVLLIIGRLVHPGSERHLFRWAQHLSGLDELMKSDFEQLSLNRLYNGSDRRYQHQTAIEAQLRARENDLFSLDETIILYALTNTSVEGRAESNSKAKFGRSNEKRDDCRRLTLGLVIDSQGFPKTSQVFAGNQTEPETLWDMIKALHQHDPTGQRMSTVVIDAGIATEENLTVLQGQYHYIVVSRQKMAAPDCEHGIVIKQSKDNKVEATHIGGDGEVFLYCQSHLNQQKERSMQSRFRQHFDEQLSRLSQSIHKKGCPNSYAKVLVWLGRLKENYQQISRFYQIDVEEKDCLASRLRWRYLKEPSDQRFAGAYFLRTDRIDLSEKDMWSIYTMLTPLEDAFRTLKTDLLLRPVLHQKEQPSAAKLQ